MTKNQQAISWGLTSFFGVICLAAAPQLSIGLFIKYGIVSTALGFGITAISNAVGDLFPDDGSASSYSGGASSVNYNHTDITINPTPRRGFWADLFSYDTSNYYGRPYSSNRHTSHGTHVGTRYESVTPTPQHQTPSFAGANRTIHGEHLSTHYEAVPTAPVFDSWFSGSNSKPAEEYLGSRTESVIPTPTYFPSYSSNASKPAETFLGSRYEPVNSNSGGGWFSGSDASTNDFGKPATEHLGTRYEPC